MYFANRFTDYDSLYGRPERLTYYDTRHRCLVTACVIDLGARRVTAVGQASHKDTPPEYVATYSPRPETLDKIETHLAQNPGITVSKIAKALNLSTMTVSRTLRIIEAEGRAQRVERGSTTKGKKGDRWYSLEVGTL